MTPRGIRNNNPGNVRANGQAWQGMTGVDDAGFMTFDEAEDGIRALAKVLITYQKKHGLTTISGIIHRWAPPNGNDTDAYIESVCRACSASPDNPYALTPWHLVALVTAIIKHENGIQPYAADVIQSGVDRAFT